MSRKIGLIINPIAGMGGKIGLKGTDGEEILANAVKLGAEPESHIKARRTVEKLKQIKDEIIILTASDSMGEVACDGSGIGYKVVYEILCNKTTYADTEEASRKMLESGAEIIIFAGGDGTARNIYNSVKDKIPVIGIPAGVKIQSAVFSQNPEYAGMMAVEFIRNNNLQFKDMEVIDLDENAYRKGRIGSTLYGYMKVPFMPQYVQNAKQIGFASDDDKFNSIAKYIIDDMNDDYYYIIGSGTTTKRIMENLELSYELLGIDVIYRKKVILNDATENQLIDIVSKNKTKIVVSPIGGQGFIFGRGNHQISGKVINTVGKNNIVIIAPDDKLYSINDSKLKVDCDNPETNEYLKGYYNVVTGYGMFISMYCN